MRATQTHAKATNIMLTGVRSVAGEGFSRRMKSNISRSNTVKTKPKQGMKEAKARKTYLFRIYPTRKQITTLEQWLGLCCQLYNAALDERKSAHRMAGVSLSYEHQCAECLNAKRYNRTCVTCRRRSSWTQSNGCAWPLTIIFDAFKQGRNQAIPALNRVSAMIP